MLLMFAMCKVADTSASEGSRMGWMWTIAFSKGFLVGPFLHYTHFMTPGLLVQALTYTALMFGSFTAISLFSKRRSYLFVGGIIGSITSALFWWSLGTWLFGARSLQLSTLPYLMITLLLACLYIVYDTQLIIERAESGDRNVPMHTLMLFVDLFDLFIRIVRIL